MERTSKQIRKQLKDTWKRLRHIWLFDRNFSVPTVDEFKNILKEMESDKVGDVGLHDLHNVGDVWDCDDFSMLASALMRLNWKLKGNRLPIPFGRAMGNEFRGMPMLHSLNICITQEGIYFVDYDDGGRLWEASSENDTVFYVSI